MMSPELFAIVGAGIILLAAYRPGRRVSDEIYLHSHWQYAPARSLAMDAVAYASSIPVQGDSSFTSEVNNALALIAEHAPDDMSFISGHLRSIAYGGECPDRMAQMDVPATCTIFDPGLNGSTISLAKTIAHEAYHAYQYANGLPFDEGPAEDYERQLGAKLRGG